MADWVWKGVKSYVIGCFDQLSLNKFFELSTPSMRNIEPPTESDPRLLGALINFC